MELAGDELVADANMISTHEIEIGASVDQTWPWIVQIGQGRGGFYSYAWLENLIGCKIKNADRIYQHWQELNAGDQIAIHPRARKLVVALIEPPNHLVLVQHRPFCWSWSFNLVPTNDQACRLLVRTRIQWNRKLLRWMIGPVMQTGHYIMERKMRLGIRQRAEENKRVT